MPVCSRLNIKLGKKQTKFYIVVALPVGCTDAKLGCLWKPREQEIKLFETVAIFILFYKIINGIVTRLKVINANKLVEEQREK
jgi:hypothetical protein